MPGGLLRTSAESLKVIVRDGKVKGEVTCSAAKAVATTGFAPDRLNYRYCGLLTKFGLGLRAESDRCFSD